MKKQKIQLVYRDAGTGRFTTGKRAAKNQSTTVRERIRR
jgi:hypothetical protein